MSTLLSAKTSTFSFVGPLCISNIEYVKATDRIASAHAKTPKNSKFSCLPNSNHSNLAIRVCVTGILGKILPLTSGVNTCILSPASKVPFSSSILLHQAPISSKCHFFHAIIQVVNKNKTTGCACAFDIVVLFALVKHSATNNTADGIAIN